MVLIATILVAITLIVTNTNPVALARNNFFIFSSQASTPVSVASPGRVMGASETGGKIGVQANAAAADQASLTPLPEDKPIAPVLKSVYRKAPEIAARAAVIIEIGRATCRESV